MPNRKGQRLLLQRSVGGAFDLFSSRLEITDLQQSVVSARQQSVRAAVERRLRVLDSFLTGSYRRHTMIGPLTAADVDLFCVLDPGYHHLNGQAALLDTTRKALRETYPRTPRISANGQAVTIRFTDFTVEVVPAFYRRGGGFLIPSSNERRWIESDPKVHEAFVARANAVHGGKLVPLIKMIKAWNRNSGSRFSSFYLELMVESILRDRTIADHPGAVTYVFWRAQEVARWKLPDPAALDAGQVNGIAHGGVPEAVAAVVRAYNLALEAVRLEQSGLISRSKACWRKVFGDPFPAG